MMRKILLAWLLMMSIGTLSAQEQSTRFLPQSRRIDRGINAPANRFGYKGEWMLGLTASYGTLSAEDTDLLVYLSDIDLDVALTTVKPFVGYFYADNRCVGMRMGYQYSNADLGNFGVDLGEQNDITLNIARRKANVGNENNGITVLHSALCGLYHKVAKRVLGLEDAGGVQKDKLILPTCLNPRNARTRGLRLAGDDGDLLSEYCVQKRRFPHVGATDNADKSGSFHVDHSFTIIVVLRDKRADPL